MWNSLTELEGVMPDNGALTKTSKSIIKTAKRMK